MTREITHADLDDGADDDREHTLRSAADRLRAPNPAPPKRRGGASGRNQLTAARRGAAPAAAKTSTATISR